MKRTNKVNRPIKASHYANVIIGKFNKECGFDPVGARRRATKSLSLNGFSYSQIERFLS